MPKRTDIHSILIPGSGPIVIGQACEFDYSGTQACRALRKEGYRIILLNSNPATIMTDPSIADATYIEPLTPEILKRVIEKEKPDAILPTVGGQTALNLVMDLHRTGFIDEKGVKLIGASVAAIEKAESRKAFKEAMIRIGMQVPESALCHSFQEALEFKNRIGLPLIIRPSFTLGGTGGGIAFTEADFDHLVHYGLDASPTTQILLEQSILGWKEFELEVMRDIADNVVIVCSIENLDPMGVHTGDSITVAPQQTLSDVQYQQMRDAAIAIIREIGVDTGGSNIQFAVNPINGEMMVVEMNPRVSRSSALASKATGFPIAKIAALLAVGYTLDEIVNDITRVTPASFEPTIDYVVTKIPRFNFEKFPGSSDTLGTQMKAVGETMSIGRTFKESFQKAFRSLETDRAGYGADGNLNELLRMEEWREKGFDFVVSSLKDSLSRPHPERIYDVRLAMEVEREKPGSGFTIDDIYKITGIDPWFLYQIDDLLGREAELAQSQTRIDESSILSWKEDGYSDRQIAYLNEKERIARIIERKDLPPYQKRKEVMEILNQSEAAIRNTRYEKKIQPVFRRVDTCAGEFESYTPYLYSTYETEDESSKSDKKKVMILGGGPNRIGQGIEFDYCCCHASFSLQDMGIESIMINSNPETVSTDYDTSDKLYFEPLTFEDVMNICELEKPDGIIVQFGGQTPLKLARALEKAGVPIIGTSPDSIDLAEDRDRFSEMLKKLDLLQPENGFAWDLNEAEQVIDRIGYPSLVRPSYVLGGRAMAVVHDREQLESFMAHAEKINPEHPILIDRFLQEAIEVDVDALCDGEDVFVAGIMEHIEEAGVHSGDSANMIPPQSLSEEILKEIERATRKIALELQVKGLLNIQYAVQKNRLYIIEVNPRASRTVPFVSKAIGLPLAGIATRIMCGEKLKNMNYPWSRKSGYIAVKEAVLPFSRFPGADVILGPEMKSTGEVMGIAPSLEEAFYKAQISAGEKVPQKGGVFFSVNNDAKPHLLEEASRLHGMGFKIYGTKGTCEFLKAHGIDSAVLYKMREEQSPHALDMIRQGEVQIIINIPSSVKTRDDAFLIRQEAIRHHILYVTTIPGTKALVNGLLRMQNHDMEVHSLQEIFP